MSPFHALRAAVERRNDLTPAGLTVAVASVAALVLGWTLRLRTVALVGLGLGVVLAVAWLLARRRPTLTATRSALPSRLRHGSTLEVELQVTGRAGGDVVLEEVLGAALGGGVTFTGAGGASTRTYRCTAARRGVHQVGPLVARWSDPFGLVRGERELLGPTEVLVHPRVEAVRDRVVARAWEDPPVRPPVSRPWPVGYELHSLRDYVDGDDPRRIAWRASARHGTPLVRQAEQGTTDAVALHVDAGASAHPRRPGADVDAPIASFERAVEAVASIAERHLADGLRVSVATGAGPLVTDLRGQTRRVELLDALARAGLDDAPLARLVDQVLSGRRTATHHVLVTTHLTLADATRLRPHVERGGSLTLVLVVDDRTDPASLHAAAGIGCPVVEARADRPLLAAAAVTAGVRLPMGGTR